MAYAFVDFGMPANVSLRSRLFVIAIARLMLALRPNIDKQLSLIGRFARLSRYIDAHLDEPVSLAELADIACMTKHRLDSAFHAYAQETPIGRLWRLRLLRARRQIAADAHRPLIDIALDAGYASSQAFSRAFRRAHRKSPAACRHEQVLALPALRIERLPAMSIQYIPFEGARSDLALASNELRARAMSFSIDRSKRFGWQVDVESHLYAVGPSAPVSMKAALLDAPLEVRIGGLDAGLVGGSTYAVFRFEHGLRLPAKQEMLTRIEQETGWRAVEGAWLRRCRNAQYLPSVLEKYFEIYVPVAPGSRRPQREAAPFVLEK